MSNWEWQNEAGRAFAPEPETYVRGVALEDPEADGPDLTLVSAVHTRLIQEIDPQRLYQLERGQAYEAVVTAARRTLAEMAPNVVGAARDGILDAVADEVLGLGPIEKLVRDPVVSEIMVNGPELVYFEQAGVIHKSRIHFRDDEHIMRIIQRIVAPLGRRIDEASPYVDARLPDGSRVNAIIPPISYRGPLITIRKFLGDKYTVADLVGVGTMSPNVADFIGRAIRAKLNILISGGTGTGKTTLLNAL
jgi:pilus assembly protein CpaF